MVMFVVRIACISVCGTSGVYTNFVHRCTITVRSGTCTDCSVFVKERMGTRSLCRRVRGSLTVR